MYQIDKENNRIIPLEQKTFSDLQFKEREHLQEWIAENPSSLGEELLIIQKEFSGFNDTYERLDLLAIDTDGKLVVIENKLDDSGKDVTWQALKYASYCSSLSKENIIDIYQRYIGSERNAEKEISDFLSGELDMLNKATKPRIILIAANFKKEVTSTVLWLIGYKLDITCFKTTPYQLDDKLFLSFEQIIPTKDVEEYMIKMADKALENVSINESELQSRHYVRLEFWEALLPKLKGITPIFQHNKPTKDNMLYAGGTDITYGSYILTITSTYCSVGLKFYRNETKENKFIFDNIYQHKSDIESSFGEPLIWDRGDDKKQSVISFKKDGVNVFNKEDWDNIINFFVQYVALFEKSFRGLLPKVKSALTDYTKGDRN